MEEREYNALWPYVARILREKLNYEKKFLSSFEKRLNSEDFFIKRQAEGNIPSCKTRIEELEKAIQHLKTFKKTKND